MCVVMTVVCLAKGLLKRISFLSLDQLPDTRYQMHRNLRPPTVTVNKAGLPIQSSQHPKRDPGLAQQADEHTIATRFSQYDALQL